MIKMTEKITLRGHHIEALAEAYATKKGFFIVKSGKGPAEIEYEKKLEQYKKEFGIEAYIQLKTKLDSKPSLMGPEYEKRKTEKQNILNFLEDKWLANSDLEVIAKNGPDSMCQACPCQQDCIGAKNNDAQEDHEQDKLGLIAYGLEENKTYSIGKLISKFLKYMKETQFPSPRTKNGFGRAEWDKIIRNPILEEIKA